MLSPMSLAANASMPPAAQLKLRVSRVTLHSRPVVADSLYVSVRAALYYGKSMLTEWKETVAARALTGASAGLLMAYGVWLSLWHRCRSAFRCRVSIMCRMVPHPPTSDAGLSPCVDGMYVARWPVACAPLDLSLSIKDILPGTRIVVSVLLEDDEDNPVSVLTVLVCRCRSRHHVATLCAGLLG